METRSTELPPPNSCRGLWRKLRCERGQQLAELAIVLPFLVLILLGAIDLGRAFRTYTSLTNAAREAARYAAVNSTATSGQVSAVVNQELGGSLGGCVSGTLEVVAPTPSAVGRGNVYTLTVRCKFQIVTPLLGAAIGADGNNRIWVNSTASFVID